jgi:hypothetical protein
MCKYVDVAGIPQPASAAAAAAAAAAPPAPDLPRAFAVGGGGPAPAPKRRLCSKCQQPGHQANSKKCSMNQKLELSSDEDGAVKDGTGEAGENLTQ